MQIILRDLLYPPSIPFLRSIILTMLIVGFVLHGHAQSGHQSNSEIRASRIDSIFSKAESDSLRTSGVLRYDYYFSNATPGQLKKMSEKFERDSFETIILQTNEGREWRMTIMKNEIHSRQSMLRTDKKMRSMAYQFIIDRYDGFMISKPLQNPLNVSEDSFGSFINSLDNEALFTSANYLISHAAYDRAMLAYQESINRHFKEDTSQYQMGNALVAKNKLVKGIERWETARNLNPKYLDAYLKLGKIFFENSHFNRALYNFEKADAIDSDNDQILYQLSETLYKLGRYNASYQYAERAVRLNHKNVFAKSMVDILDQPDLKKLRKQFPQM
ncbi:MAG: tetratricopeptide repeat protein [Saprospiraceae bacterium]|uniref:Tetratricopeptide repeat protein n=1 Tax=Candidatus Opimibacter skivensis TaxID=2982028 RepID=A0A9D7XRE8_9BACT|nr:tetratricopeptide repeat protein [Candidatus Opimibacter skivensis]